MINWNEPLECKVWGCKHEALNHDWQPVRKVEANHHGTYVVYDDETPFYFDWVLLNGEIINRQNGKQIGLVRNKKAPQVLTEKEAGSPFDRVKVPLPIIVRNTTFEGNITKLPSAKTLAYQFDCAYREDGITHATLSYLHDKHDMVIYYEDLGDKVKITGWEGIMNYEDVCRLGVINEYIKESERVYSNWDETDGLAVFYHTQGTISLRTDIKRNEILLWEEFNEVLQHIKKAAENLHNIRKEQKEHKVKKMKAII